MYRDERDPGPISAEEHARGVRVGFLDGTWDIHFPPGWQANLSDEDDLWCWSSGELAGRIRLRRHPRIQLEVDVTNGGADVAQVVSPRVELSPAGQQVPWFSGSAGEVLVAMPGQTVLWVQQRGSCVAGTAGFGLFADPLLLRPGQGASAVWRREVLPPQSLIPEPPWVPRQRYLARGQVLDVEHTDAALTGDGLQIVTTVDGSHVEGEVGLHELCFLDARGTALVEVGWFASLTELAGSPSALFDADPNLVAWLLAAAVDAAVDPDGDLDDLDVALAEALERPTAWGVLAGMRAAARTDLPVADEVREAARVVWDSEADPHLRRLMITHGLLCGWEPELVGAWMARGPATMNEVLLVGPQEMLASIGFGRITSSATVHRGRSVAVASMWLSACAESGMASEWEHAVETSRRRLMCALSSAPDATDIAWLLASSLLS